MQQLALPSIIHNSFFVRAAKALVVSKLIAIFYARHGKS